MTNIAKKVFFSGAIILSLLLSAGKIQASFALFNDESYKTPIETNVFIFEKIDGDVDIHYIQKFKSIESNDIGLLPIDLLDYEISTHEASIYKKIERASTPEQNLLNKVRSLPDGFEKTLSDYFDDTSDDVSLHPSAILDKNHKFEDVENLETALDILGVESFNENLIKDSEAILGSGKSIVLLKFSENNNEPITQPVVISGGTKFGYPSLVFNSGIKNTGKIRVFVISDSRKVSTESRLKLKSAKKISLLDFEIDSYPNLKMYGDGKVWITRFEGEMNEDWSDTIGFTDSGDQSELGGGEMSKSDWLEFPKEVFLSAYLRNFYGQFFVFVILILFQVFVRKKFLRIVFWVLQSPFIIFTSIFSLKNLGDKFFFESSGNFSEDLFGAIPYIFFLMLLVLIVSYQTIKQSLNKESDIDLELVEMGRENKYLELEKDGEEQIVEVKMLEEGENVTEEKPEEKKLKSKRKRGRPRKKPKQESESKKSKKEKNG